MVVLQKGNAFLIKVDSTRKNFVPSNFSALAGIPIFAEDVLLHTRFTLDDESIKQNSDFEIVKQNDYIVVFCNSVVPHSPNQIKFIFKVSGKIDNQIILKPFLKLKMGYNLEHLFSLVEEGKLSKSFLNCQKIGFKICQINFSDLELLINYDPLVRTYHSTSWKLN